MLNKIIIGVVILAIAGGLVWFINWKSVENEAEVNAEVVVEAPEANAIVASPLTIRGEARGTWFFEANIVVSLLDADENVIAQTGGMAEGEWMTEDFVPFSAQLTFDTPKTKAGILRIKNDNPSGLSEFDKFFDVPVVFSEEPGSITEQPADILNIKVFFGSSKLDPQSLECKSYPVIRSIPKTSGIASASIKELLLGPTETERKGGYFTSLPEGVELKTISLANGVLTLEFNEALNQVGGSCKVTAIRSQITETARQFPTVKEVSISIGGRTEDILQP